LIVFLRRIPAAPLMEHPPSRRT